MVGDDHNRDGEERSSRVGRPVEDEADDAAGHTGEGSDLQQRVLVQDAASKRLNSHVKDVPSDPEDEDDGERRDEPGCALGEVAGKVQVQ